MPPFGTYWQGLGFCMSGTWDPIWTGPKFKVNLAVVGEKQLAQSQCHASLLNKYLPAHADFKIFITRVNNWPNVYFKERADAI